MKTHELRFIRTGSVPSREDLMIMGGNANIVHDGPVLIYYLRINKDIVLVDTSFHMDDAKTLGIDSATKRVLPDEDPLYALNKIGIKREDVTKIILSHAHVDHIGYIDAFPNATIYIHRKELAWVMALPKWAVGYGQFSVEKLQKVRQQLHVIDGDRYQILPGVEVIYVGGHTPGSLAVLVDTKIGRVCLCLDNAYLYRNIEENIPIELTNNLYENLSFHEKLPFLADVFVPGHDPLLLQKYPDGVIG